MELQAKLHIRGDVTVVYCQGRIISSEVEELAGKISSLLPGQRRIVLHLGKAEVERGELLHLAIQYLRAQGCGCQIKLAGVPPSFTALLRESHMERVFEIYPTEDDAITSFTGRARSLAGKNGGSLASQASA